MKARKSKSPMNIPGIAVTKTATRPIRAVNIPHAPAKALYPVDAGADPYRCHRIAVMERARTMAQKTIWSTRTMLETIMLSACDVMKLMC